MDSSASHPPGFSRRWEGSSSSASPCRGDHVSGLGISSASSGGSVAAPLVEGGEVAQPEARGRVQDRLGWEQPPPSKKTLWRRRVEARNASGPAAWGAPAQEMEGLCFRCFEPGHRKRDCINAEVCLRCWQRGHPAKGCTRPRSPSSEDELRERALAKMARRRSPVRGMETRAVGRGGVAPAPAPPCPPPPPQSPPLPPPPPPPPALSRLPPMEAWPPISVRPVRAVEQPELVEVGPEEPQLCVVRRTETMGDLEQRLQFAMVASVGGRRPAVTCEQVLAALKWRGVPEGAVSVHAYAPEDFLVIFATAELRDHVASRPPVLVAGAPLSWRPWNRQAQAELVPLKSRVWLILEGIPPHAWDIAVEAIPVARMLAVPEPASGEDLQGRSSATVVREGARRAAKAQAARPILALQYKVLIHVVRVEEEERTSSLRGPGQREPGPGGFQGHGPSGASGGGGEGGQARWAGRDFAWQRGVPDRRAGPGGFPARRRVGGDRQREVEDDDVAAPQPLACGLPCMDSPEPLVVRPAKAGQKVATPVSGVVGQPLHAARDVPEPLVCREPGVECAVAPPLLTGLGVVEKISGERRMDADKPQQEFQTEVGPAAEKMDGFVWQDAVEDLDPEELGRAEAETKEGLLIGEVDALSPSLSSVGSRVGPAVEQCQGGPDEKGLPLGSDVHGGSYFAVSVSIPERIGSRAQPCMVERELFSATGDRGGEDSPSLSYTGPNSSMQMVPRVAGQGREKEQEGVQEVQDQQVSDNRELDRQELARVRGFCASILKTLAPPLLQEIERASKLRAEAEPFTPKRVTRRTVAANTATQVKKASAAENALLKALGICPENLSVREEDLARFRGIFDSPVSDSHLRVLASIFGKELPASFTPQEYCQVAVAAH
ncbi:hypothetical protein QYE76_063422 [Lolium multiflorum]|uniref:CCHC-type domain-containing protein n=1 Tax=Lolium multiflorum TaxID=4521 RepID=A0AAD8W9A7_LOLMU|nr:hypothetical protein QYE76_063422 [Lolium multiflorum]